MSSFMQLEYKDPQRPCDEAASLRRALQDAELELQRMTDTHRRELENIAKVTSQHIGLICYPLEL